MFDDTRVLRRTARDAAPGPHRIDLFADEIAVDFPSIGAVAERMRDAFLAADDGRALLAAEVRLSRRDAEHGRRVPLDLTLQCTCPRCGGRGEVWSERCRTCDGSGCAFSRHQVQVYVPSGVRDGARFHFSVAPPEALATLVQLRVSVG